MSTEWEGGRNLKFDKKTKRPKIILHLLSILFLFSLIYFTFFVLIEKNFEGKVKSDDLNSLNLFPLVEKAKGVSYMIKSRESFIQDSVRRVYYEIEVPKIISREQFMGLAQKIVKETIYQEKCHSIAIDFGPAGYVDFAPFGNWVKAGEVPLDNYENYKFRYIFFN